MKALISRIKKGGTDPREKMIKPLRAVVCFGIYLAIIALIVSFGELLYDMYVSLYNHNVRNVLHSVALVLVTIKAFRILVSYLRTYHVSIKYIMEIAIIASTVELIFASETLNWWQALLFAVFGLGNLTLFLLWGDKIKEDNE